LWQHNEWNIQQFYLISVEKDPSEGVNFFNSQCLVNPSRNVSRTLAESCTPKMDLNHFYLETFSLFVFVFSFRDCFFNTAKCAWNINEWYTQKSLFLCVTRVTSFQTFFLSSFSEALGLRIWKLCTHTEKSMRKSWNVNYSVKTVQGFSFACFK
jgi:hypothetical protein